MKKSCVLCVLALVMVLSIATAVPAMAAPTASSRSLEVGFQYGPLIGGGVYVGIPFGKDFSFASRVGTVIDLDGGTLIGLQAGLRYYFGNDNPIRMFSVLYAGGIADFAAGGTTTFTFVGTLGAGLQYNTSSGAFGSVEIDTNWVDRSTVPGYSLGFTVGKRF